MSRVCVYSIIVCVTVSMGQYSYYSGGVCARTTRSRATYTYVHIRHPIPLP